MTLAWHFLRADGRLRDGRTAPRDGVVLIHDGPVIPCVAGLHASRHPFDALRYAPGPILCLVRCGGIIVPHGDPEDKLACSERTIIARMDFAEPLRYFARMRALSVVHLWDAPDVVLDYLMSGDEAIRAAARAAAWYAASAAASAAARYAAWEAAWEAARNAALAAALAAARAAARAAAMADARDDARAAAKTEFAALVHECFEAPLMEAQK